MSPRPDKDVQPCTTEGVALNGQRSVLIVDRSEETREVLQTVLERRGVRTLAAGRTAAGLELARRHQPDLIVLDLEWTTWRNAPRNWWGRHSCLPRDRQECLPHRPQYQPRLVLLGNLRGWRDRLPEGEFVPKPYHYGPLIRKIEELLASGEQGDGPCRRCSSSAEPIRAAASS